MKRKNSNATLQKPKAVEGISRKSSTCQPGSVSIKYSEMLLVEPIPSFISRLSPALFTVVSENKALFPVVVDDKALVTVVFEDKVLFTVEFGVEVFAVEG